jgi:hypothetical protein
VLVQAYTMYRVGRAKVAADGTVTDAATAKGWFS